MMEGLIKIKPFRVFLVLKVIYYLTKDNTILI